MITGQCLVEKDCKPLLDEMQACKVASCTLLALVHLGDVDFGMLSFQAINQLWTKSFQG